MANISYRSVVISAAAAVLLLASPKALAGPDWDEACDAGSTPSTAQVIPVTVRTIKGKLNACSPLAGTPDLEDMYQFTINSPSIFCARTVLLSDQVDCCNQPIFPTQGTMFNTQLWLFKSDGHGLLANDDETGASQLSRLPNAANDGSGAMVIAPGTYYLAISSGPNRDPISTGGLIFNQASLTEVSGPDGPGGANPIIGWTGGGVSGPTIKYEIVICGSVPAQIPAVSQIGLVILIGLILAAGAIMIARRHSPLFVA